MKSQVCRDPAVAPLQTKQGNRPTGHDQEGRRGLNEVVPGTSVFPSGEPGVSAGDLRELARVPLRGEGSCGGGGAPRDSAGSGATALKGNTEVPGTTSFKPLLPS